MVIEAARLIVDTRNATGGARLGLAESGGQPGAHVFRLGAPQQKTREAETAAA
jgi:hypothetical protein